jgi:hypothetical protein
MKIKRFIVSVGAAVLGLSGLSAHAIPSLFEYGFNIDGTVSDITLGDAVPGGVNVAGFDDVSGLGTITVSISGAGAHTFDAFFDHEIDEAINTYFNESGAATGVASAGQSWEIDEPGFVFGDIYTNFEDSTLDNSNGVPAGLEDDVSLAMGWDFFLGVGDTATISLLLSETMPTGGFYLSHTDPDSNYTFYLSSALDITGTPPAPEPTLVYLLAIGMAGLLATSRRRSLSKV